MVVLIRYVWFCSLIQSLSVHTETTWPSAGTSLYGGNIEALCRPFIQNGQVPGFFLSVPSTGGLPDPDSLTAVFYSLRSALIPEPQTIACYSVVVTTIYTEDLTTSLQLRIYTKQSDLSTTFLDGFVYSKKYNEVQGRTRLSPFLMVRIAESLENRGWGWSKPLFVKKPKNGILQKKWLGKKTGNP